MAQAPRAGTLFPQVRSATARPAGAPAGVCDDLGPLSFRCAARPVGHPMPVIESLLDTDLYKLTMMQAVLHQHPAAHATYRFRCRTPGVDLARHVDAISREID